MAEATRSRIGAFGIEYEGKTGLSTVDLLLGRLSPDRRSRAEVSDARRAGLALTRLPALGSSPRPLLFVLAAVGWWSTVDRMQGMDDGPWTGLGTFGWFLGIWVVMMAAMMFPSVAPTVALYSRMTKDARPFAAPLHRRLPRSRGERPGRSRSRSRCSEARRRRSARLGPRGAWVAGGTLLVAAAYELTPLKDVCLGKCRSPLGFLLGSWREGRPGAYGWASGTAPGASAAAGR